MHRRRAHISRFPGGYQSLAPGWPGVRSNGLFRYRDLASLTPEKLVQLGGSTYRQAEAIIRFAAEHDEAENWW